MLGQKFKRIWKKQKKKKISGDESQVDQAELQPIPEEELNKLNPYMRSIAGESILNLSAYGNKLKVYYATSSAADTAHLNAWIESAEKLPKTKSLDWDDGGKTSAEVEVTGSGAKQDFTIELK